MPPDGGGKQDAQPQEQPGAQGDRSPSERLRDIEKRRRGAEQRRQMSERLRQRARDMAEGRAPRRDPAQDPGPAPDSTARDGHDDGTVPPEQRAGERRPFEGTDDVDVAGDEPSDRVIAEWLDDDPSASPPADGTAAPPRARRVRQAQEVAERAVNESTVPSRYHRLIKEYFQRLEKTVDKAGEETKRRRDEETK